MDNPLTPAELLRLLQVLTDQRSWGDLGSVVFQLLYNEPWEAQIALACWAMKEYIPIYTNRKPERSWSAELVEDPAQWLRVAGRQLPNRGEGNLSPGDSKFELCCEGLLLACSSYSSRLIVTSSCTYCIYNSISARMLTIWATDDPKAVEGWNAIHSVNVSEDPENDFEIDPALFDQMRNRTYIHNVGAIAVGVREWKKLVAHLSQMSFSYQPDSAEATQRDLSVWKENEELLLFSFQG